MKEIWKDIEGYEGYYQISNFGKVRSLTRYVNENRLVLGKELKQKYDKDGYCNIGLSREGKKKYFRVNRLVALAFIPNPDNLPMINHINGKRDDNMVTNLEWCDNSYNQWHRCHINNNSPNNEYKKIKVEAILPDNTILNFNSITECAEYFHSSRTAIYKKLKNEIPNGNGIVHNSYLKNIIFKKSE